MPNTFTDNFGNEYMDPFIPQKVVGFTGIDPDIVSSGSGCTCSHDLSDEQRTQVNQMLVDYITNLTVKIDSGDVSTPIPPMPYVVVSPDEIPHNGLNGLQGGQSGEYYHLTAEELQRLQALITATFPSGATTPLFPSGGGGSGGGDSGGGTGGGGSGDGDDSGDGGSGGGDDGPEYDPFGGLPPTMSADWTKEKFVLDKASNYYDTYADAGEMYYGTIPISINPYSTTALVVPVRRNGKTTEIALTYTENLTVWKDYRQSITSACGSNANSYLYVDYNKSTTNNKIYRRLYAMLTPNTNKAVYYMCSSGWNNTSMYAASTTAGCYSPELRRLLFVSQDGSITILRDTSSSTSNSPNMAKWTTQKPNCGLSEVNPGGVIWIPNEHLFCITGKDGTATSEYGESGTWTVHSGSDVPKNLHGLCLRSDLEKINEEVVFAWSRDDKLFYVSRDGKAWERYSRKAIPLTEVKSVAYSPELDCYCAVGAPDNIAYFSKNLKDWVSTTVNAKDAVTANSVIWMANTKKFVLLPSSGREVYTYSFE